MREKRTKRRSRLSRSASSPGFILQERDKKIIRAVFQYRHLTRSQIQKLFDFKCITRMNIRLRKLFDHRFLDRRFLPIVTGSSEAIYSLGTAGIPVVAEILGEERTEIKKRRSSGLLAKNAYLCHDLAVNDLRICLIKDIKDRPAFRLLKWLKPRECECRFQARGNGVVKERRLKPDDLFQLVHNGKLYSFFVEVDLSTSCHDKLNRKFRIYLDLKYMGLSQQLFGFEKFQVLVAAKTAKRRDNLKALADQLGSDLFWFTALQDAQGRFLTAKIWRRSCHELTRPLFQLSHKVVMVR